MAKRDPEPFFWMLFSAGGIVSAMLMPILILLFGIAFPLGWLAPPSHEHISAVLANPLTKLVLFVLCALSLFHWAHRFRHTLYDCFGAKPLAKLIEPLSYGGALVGTIWAAYVIF